MARRQSTPAKTCPAPDRSRRGLSFSKVLIANRGEIAVRITRTCHRLGLETVAVYSDADRCALHVQVADEAICIGPPDPRESYLNGYAVIEAARASGAGAIHPGYGFLSENPGFARDVRAANIAFVGPSAAAIAAMGDKVAARKFAADAGVHLVPSRVLDISLLGQSNEKEVVALAGEVGYPLLVKPIAGGGGKGMRVVREPEQLHGAVTAGVREATQAFGDGRVFLERYIERPRHIEVQVLGDVHGGMVHLGERECSIQRRHQKVVEETPAPGLEASARAEITAAAVAIARAVEYTNAGTVEFLLAPDGSLYFLEMNTRIQVEHAVTEWVTGIDIVAEQLRVAAGEPLGYGQAEVTSRGAALECRVYAEDPARNFLPSAGPVLAIHEPGGPGVRVDSGLAPGVAVPVEYDPLLEKVTTWASSRADAITAMREALDELVVIGPTTNCRYLADIVNHAAFRRGDTHTEFLDEHFSRWHPDLRSTRAVAAVVAALTLRAGHGLATQTGEGGAPRSPWATIGPWRIAGAGQKADA